MYYDFREEWVESNEDVLTITFLNEMDRMEIYEWRYIKDNSLTSWQQKDLTVTFEVTPQTYLPDILKNNTHFHIYSQRLIDLLSNIGLKFETFETVAIDRDSKEVLPLDYKVFRLLEAENAVDLERSDIRGEKFKDYRYRHLVVRENFPSSNKLMFREINFQTLTLIHETLKQELEEAQITGCSFFPLSRIYGGFWPKEELSSVLSLSANANNDSAKEIGTPQINEAQIPNLHSPNDYSSYYIFDSALVYVGEEAIIAKLLKKPDFDYLLSWRNMEKGALQPAWSQEKSPFVFQVDEEVEDHPDNYTNWASLDLYSAHLIELIANIGGNFETFDTNLLGRESKQKLPLDYKVFRLLETHNAIDLERSDVRKLDGKTYRRHLKLKEEFVNAAKPVPIFREHFFKVLVHETLKTAIEQSGITGCQFTPLYEYRTIGWKRAFGEDDPERLARPSTTSPKREKRKPSARQTPDERSFTEQEVQELRSDISDAWQYLSTSQDSTPQEVVKAIKAAVREMREQSLAEDDKKWAALRLGCLWGEQVCRAYDWHWAELTFKNDGEYQRTAVISPDRAYCVLPMNFVWRHFEKPEREETIALLFNMLESEDVGGIKRQADTLQTLS